MSEAPDVKEYKGNCHCGLFKFTLRIPELTSVEICGCSVCVRNAYVWICPLAEETLIIDSGKESLTTYEFGSKRMKFFFCPRCGSSVMGRIHSLRTGGIAINARMLKIDLTSLSSSRFPGEDLGAKYQPPTFPSHQELGKIQDGLKIYNGNCHCGAVTYAVKTKPLNEQQVVSCNCSSCSRNGDLWIYPSQSAITLKGKENLTGYVFLTADSLHSFCKICGCSIVVQVTDPKEDIMPVNVRNFDGMTLEKLNELEYKLYDGWGQEPSYEVCAE